MDPKIEVLKQVPLFSELSRSELQLVASVADELDVPAGTALTLEGQTGREFFVLVEGVATVEEDGKVVRTLARGDFIGEIALLTRGKRTATVKAEVPARVLILTDRAFRQLAQTIPLFASRTWMAAVERMPA
ncbi:MAG: cyclic nucleotide-binding domain-containing protein [Actinomycetota bacterium]